MNLRRCTKKAVGLVLCVMFILLAAAVPAQAGHIHYEYDALGRLISVTYGNGVSSTYTYDSGGNLLQSTTTQVSHNPIDVAVGWDHTAVVNDDGTVWTWGDNCCGQLGDGTIIARAAPVQVNGMNGIVAVAAGDLHTVALKEDGTVWAWGYNSSGQLGDGTCANRTTPVQVVGLTGVKAIAAGADHTAALKEDGTVWTWGSNYSGQLGDGTNFDSNVPVEVDYLYEVKDIAAGFLHTVALDEYGQVWAWGGNYCGQLGDGTNFDSSIPVEVEDLDEVKAIDAGEDHTVALDEYGEVWAWGGNYSGQLGDGTTADSSYPVLVDGLYGEEIIAIAAGNYHTVALDEYEQVWTWGGNYSGQLGDGTTIDRTTPVQVNGLTGVKAIDGGADNTVVLKNDGTVWAWGDNYFGQLGIGTTANKKTPVQVSTLIGAEDIAAGGYHTIALKEDSTVWVWGHNSEGQLGDGTTIDRNTPVQISGLTGVEAIAAGLYHTVALKEDGTVWAWGCNSEGQLGDGTTMDRNTPVQISGLTGVKAIAAGLYHTVALKEDGTVWAWGCNSEGQLGDGTTIDRTTPVQVNLTKITAIAAGGYHTVVINKKGTLWTWGYNADGQLGDGTTMNSTTPIQVSTLTGVEDIAAGGYHTIALKDGTVWAWGCNSEGQLGDGTTIDRTTPVQVSGLNTVIGLTSGVNHTLALKQDGTIWAWGYNVYGQLGDGTNINSPTAVQVGLTGITDIAAGGCHTAAINDCGSVYAWGYNRYGQLGDGTAWSTIPVQVNEFGNEGMEILSMDNDQELLQLTGDTYDYNEVTNWAEENAEEINRIIHDNEYLNKLKVNMHILHRIQDERYEEYLPYVIYHYPELLYYYPELQNEIESMGGIDAPVSGAAISGSDYNVRGWYLDDAGVSKIEIQIDGTTEGEAVYGDERLDVLESNPDYNEANSGFHYTLDTTALSNGEHTLTVVETNTLDQSSSKEVTFIVNNADALPVIGCIDAPASGASISGSDYNVYGWYLNDAGVSKIKIKIDGITVGKAVYGDERLDVLAAYPEYNNANAGFHYTLDTTVLSNGEHILTVVETNTLDQTSSKEVAFNVENTGVLPAMGWIDAPAAGAAISGSDYNVHGWYLDGAGVSMIEIQIDGITVDEAVYGDERLDVLESYPDYNDANSGFCYTLDTTALSNGEHTLTIVETNTLDQSSSKEVTFNVNNADALPVIGWIDAPASGAAISGSDYNVYGWYLDDAGVSMIEIQIDGTTVGEAVYGDERLDVLESYPDYNDANSGFHYTLDTTALSNGEHTLIVIETNTLDQTCAKQVSIIVNN